MEVLNNVGEDLGVRDCLGTSSPTPQMQEPPPTSTNPGIRIWIGGFFTGNSPFLNDEKLSNVGKGLGVHKGLDAPFPTSLCPRNRGRDGGDTVPGTFLPYSQS